LSLHHSCCTTVSCLLPSPLCRIPQPAPPPFVVLLRPTYSVGCPVAMWPPSTSQPAPPPLFTPLHLLVVASHPVTFSGTLAFPPPLIMPPPLVAPLSFGLLLCCMSCSPAVNPPWVPSPPPMMVPLFLAGGPSIAHPPPPPHCPHCCRLPPGRCPPGCNKHPQPTGVLTLPPLPPRCCRASTAAAALPLAALPPLPT
jgi:hypothetical protein